MKQNLIGGNAIQLQGGVILIAGVPTVQLESIEMQVDNVDHEMGMGISTSAVRVGKKYKPFEGKISMHLEAYMNLQNTSPSGRLSDISPISIQGTFTGGAVPITYTCRQCFINASTIALNGSDAMSNVDMTFTYVDFLVNGKTTAF